MLILGLLGLLLVLIFIVLILFSFPRFSPIPYYPSNKKDLPLIIKALNLKNDQIIIDLGAGDGVVIFAAASNAVSPSLITNHQPLNTLFIAVEINPVLIFIMHLRRLFHPNRKNIKIIWGDMFKVNLKTQILKLKTITKNSKLKQSTINNQQLTIYLYISPWLLEKTLAIIKKQINNFSIVSYFYPIKSLKKEEKIIQGKNKIFIYQ